MTKNTAAIASNTNNCGITSNKLAPSFMIARAAVII